MTATQDATIAGLQRTIAELRRERDAALEREATLAEALAQRNSEFGERIEHQAATIDVLKVMSASPGDARPVFELIVERARSFCGADHATAALLQDGMLHLQAYSGMSAAYGADYEVQFPRPVDTSTMFGRAILSREVMQTGDLRGERDHIARQIHTADFNSIVAVPILREGTPIGALALGRIARGGFSDSQIELLKTFAEEAVIAITSAETYRALQTRTADLQESLEYQTATSDVLKVISRSAFDLQPVLDTLVKTAARLCDAEQALIARIEGGSMWLTASIGFPPEYEADRRSQGRMPVNPSAPMVTDRAAVEKRPVHVYDAAAVPGYTDAAVRLGKQRTSLGVPLLSQGEALGVIVLARQRVEPFTDRQIELVSTFADQAVIAIENTRLITEQREALEQQTATAEILRVINESPENPLPVYDQILEKAHTVCGADVGALVTWDGTHFRALATLNYPEEVATLLRRPFLPTSIHQHLVDGQRYVHIPDAWALHEDSEFVRAFHRHTDLRTMLALALRKDNKLLGFVSAHRHGYRPYTDKEIALLESFADQAVIAMENARLITEQREALEQQTATAEVLQVINSSPSDLAPVFDALLKKAMHLCEAAFGELDTFDGERFRPAALLGIPAAYLKSRTSTPRTGMPGTIDSRFREGANLLHITDLMAEDIYRSGNIDRRSLVDLGGARTALAVALRKDDVLLGNIMIYRQEVRPFSDRQVGLLQNFAAQAVIAMENARLITETHEALEQQTATAEVLQVINASPGNLAPVFEAILEKAHDLCDIAHGDLQLYDGEYLHSVAQRGLSAEFADRLRQGYRASDSPASRPLLAGDRFTHITDAAAVDFMVFRSSVRPDGIRTVLFVPLRKDGALLGMIASARREVRPFTEKEIALLENFAAQAVIAIENARLLDELRERTEALAQRNGEFGERIEQQSATIDVLKVMSSTPDDTQPVFELIVRRAQELCKGVGASLIELEGNLVHFRASHEPATHTNDPAAVEAWRALFPMVPTLEWLSCRAILEKREVHIRDVQTDPGLSDIVRATNSDIRSHLTVPLMRDGQAIGSISLRGKEPGGFTDSQVALLRTFAEQAVIAIGSVANFRALRERTAELAQRQAELRVTFENMGDGVAMFDETQHLIAWNRKFQDILDVPDDIIARRQTFSEYVHYLSERGEYGHEADPEEHVRQLIEHAGQSRTYERTRPDGRVIEIRHNPVAGGGFVLIYADITERKRNEAEIRAARDAAEEASRTIEAAYRDLKTAQANLIQAEKMASLGQLTAGIAHEIKNPLNFVNNFAELSVDLLGELKDAIAPAEPALTEGQRAEVEEVSAMLTSNLEKITEHGKRADGIVKAMLEHSRGSSGERRKVDINALADEALNLAYHGARAQDQSFNITLERDFGEGIALIEVNPQDITRVFLNLFANGFYATTKRARDGADAGFVPTLKVTTRDAGDVVEIRVWDNGTGVPIDIRDKLFQPFFTTKPTGEGTGLGLSITYDIVTQQHGGTIAFESEVGEYSEFTIQLPRKP